MTQQNLNKHIIIDLDGCFADDEWRLDLIQSEMEPCFEKWREYHEASVKDFPIESSRTHLRHVVERLRRDGCCTNIAVFTARPESFRKQTAAWVRKFLAPHVGFDMFHLSMRPDNDTTPAPELKSHMLQQYETLCTKPFDGEVCLAYDDRADVLTEYDKRGIPCVLASKATLVPFVAQEVPVEAAASTCRIFFGAANAAAECTVVVKSDQAATVNASHMLLAAAETFAERNAVYKDNATVVGQLMRVLFPDGVSLSSAEDFHKWHLFELVIVKLTRYVASGLTHQDSARDSSVYWAMLEALESNKGNVS